MKRLIAALFALLFLAAPALAQTKPDRPLWPHLVSDIAPDPAVTWGALPNGMRYALMKNQLPPGAVSIRLSFAFGSLAEADTEKGLAHFIEHMAFNGSKAVPEGDMVKILERLGLSFGADTNASTGQSSPPTRSSSPTLPTSLVDESLFLLREVSSELSFDAAAIDRERGVVLSEWRRGDNFARRRSDQQLNFLIPGAYAASRMPIGDPKILETASRETLVSLYDRYYRPERATLVMVGDFDIAAVERKIAAKFGDWTGRGEPGKDADLSYTIRDRPSEASVFTHKDGGDSISAYSLMPFRDEPDTAGQRRLDNLLMFAIGAFGRRLAPLANSEDPPFRSATLSTGGHARDGRCGRRLGFADARRMEAGPADARTGNAPGAALWLHAGRSRPPGRSSAHQPEELRRTGEHPSHRRAHVPASLRDPERDHIRHAFIRARALRVVGG